ncbi:phospholipase A1 [Dysgonomonas hofstadii]|uniref:Phosphatidylcholine 1-acylhydrolase n=1 Tax=Dysgonomonas hofstadii TaxID=637886 RepID=A0A840CU60_9BACT|nr:phospholipase A [Dysgonomonas hofstadii]MBB4037738.1 phospholipase A1 [Dysgonomonas hofstadii]
MRFFYFFVLCLLTLTPAFAQNETTQDPVNTEKQNKDTTDGKIRTFIDHQADAIVGSMFGASKQLSNADSIINRFDALPSFGIYKDNYFIVGTDLFHKPNDWNSDAKFQVSIRQRLTNSTLPFKTYFFLTYTQKAFWNVFQDSFPFRDLNFNPTLGLGRAVVRHNRFLGTVMLQFEHESNGKDGDASRSWNKISFGTNLMFNDRWTFHAKAWIPIVDGTNNKDIVHYSGWGSFGMEYSSPKRKYNASLFINKRGGVNLNANIVANFSVRLFSDDSQYLFLEYYNGYGESMLDYKQYRQRLRLGIVIKPDFLSIY